MILWVVAGAAAIGALAYFGLSGSHSAQAGRPAPALPRESLSGSPVTLPQLLAGARGRRSLVVFWASWCGPCASEAPALERIAGGAAGSGRVVGVNWSDELAGARRFIRRYHWAFPNLRDGDGSVGYAYRIVNLPTSFVVGAGGRIEAVLRGPQTQAQFEHALH